MFLWVRNNQFQKEKKRNVRLSIIFERSWEEGPKTEVPIFMIKQCDFHDIYAVHITNQ